MTSAPISNSTSSTSQSTMAASLPVLVNLGLSIVLPLLIAILAGSLGYAKLVARPAPHPKAPKLWTAHHYPIIGSGYAYFKNRFDLMQGIRAADAGKEKEKNGASSFYIGRKHVVFLSGPDGIKTVFNGPRGLSLGAGFVELLAGALPDAANEVAQDGALMRFFTKTMVALVRPDVLARKVGFLCRHVRALCDELSPRSQQAESEWHVMDPFDCITRLLFRMPAGIVGATELAEDDRLLTRSMKLFDAFERCNSPVGVVFPWLAVVTPSYWIRIGIAALLYRTFSNLVSERKRTGTRHEDGLQYLMDKDHSMKEILIVSFFPFLFHSRHAQSYTDARHSQFQINAIFASALSTAPVGTWLLVALAAYPEWQNRCRDEVERAMAAAKDKTKDTNCNKPNYDGSSILADFTFDEWDSERFPVISACIHELLRLVLTFCAIRKNDSGADIPIAASGPGAGGTVIPNGSFVVYMADDLHLNPEHYPDPETYDPGRHLGEDGSFTSKPGSFLGWGAGRHACCKS